MFDDTAISIGYRRQYK